MLAQEFVRVLSPHVSSDGRRQAEGLSTDVTRLKFAIGAFASSRSCSSRCADGKVPAFADVMRARPFVRVLSPYVSSNGRPQQEGFSTDVTRLEFAIVGFASSRRCSSRDPGGKAPCVVIRG